MPHVTPALAALGLLAPIACVGAGSDDDAAPAPERTTSSASTSGHAPTTSDAGDTTDASTSTMTSTTATTTGSGASGGGEGASATSTTGDAPGEPASRCTETATTITCPKQTLELAGREVHHQVPLGDPPPGGWPVTLMFQGSFVSAEQTWSASDGTPFGAFHQTRVVKRLLDDGYAVLTPETRLDGSTYWDTNILPYATDWASAPDHQLMLAIFAAIEGGTFGPLDAQRLFAAGVSSGGYMTSRMAVSYPGKFRALAIAAGSYATCGGAICLVPEQGPGHPPTLFLQGALDLVVPLATVEVYDEALQSAGVDARLVVDPQVGHAWIPAAADEIGAWFADHP